MPTPTRPEYLSSTRTQQPSEARFPSLPTIHYRTYLDHGGRDSIVAFLEFSGPRLHPKLVDLCWTRGVPLVVWFRTAPSWKDPYWKETLKPRSIRIDETGQLRWQPMISWTCRDSKGAARQFADWLGEDRSGPPLPIVRFEFSEEIPFEEIGGTLFELADSRPCCWFKLFALPYRHRKKMEPAQWTEILKAFQDPPPTETDEDCVITLHPPR